MLSWGSLLKAKYWAQMAAVLGRLCLTREDPARRLRRSRVPSGESNSCKGQDMAKSRAGPVNRPTNLVAQ